MYIRERWQNCGIACKEIWQSAVNLSQKDIYSESQLKCMEYSKWEIENIKGLHISKVNVKSKSHRFKQSYK